MDIKQKMNAKNILVSFLVIASVLFLATAVSAASPAITVSDVTVNDVHVMSDTASVNAGDTVIVKVYFTSNVNASDVKLKATIEGNNADVTKVTPTLFDIESGKSYVKTLTLVVPSDLANSDLSENLPLDIKIWNSDISVENPTDFSLNDLNVQRASYNVAIKSVMVDSTVQAGQSVPVEVVLKNVGYDNINDVYVTLSIPELNINKQIYLGDLVTQNYKDNFPSLIVDTDKVTVSATINLAIPYNANGAYTITATASNSNDEAVTSTATQAITVQNSVSDIAMKSGNDLVVLNPTNQLKVYTVKYNSVEQTVVVSPLSSKTVSIDVPTSGDYKFDVSVLSGDTLLSTVNFSGSNQSVVELTNPVFILTVILAIVFLVLLVVLVVLITKKPQKSEEFGESYY